MTIQTTVTAMQAIHKGIAGVATAPTVYPPSLASASLPLVITWPGPGEAMLAGKAFNTSQRIYRVTCYCMPSQQGRGIDEGWQLAQELLKLFQAAYLDSTNNPLTTGTYQASIRNSSDTPITDGGLELIAYPPQATGIDGIPHYYGFQMEVRVKEQWTGS